MAPPDGLSILEARRIAVDAQGLGRTRPARAGRRELRAAIGTVGALQLDTISVVARTQFLVLFSRIGAYDTARLHAMTGPGGDVFEYWGHAASLMPMGDQPLFRWRMAQYGPVGHRPVYAARRRAFAESHADYIAAVLREVTERGPLAASQLTDPRRRDGEWWDRRSVGRLALELLFAHGELAAWRTENFERVYDLRERVVPPDVLAQPTPTREDAQRQLLVRAATALGVATARDLGNYYMFSPTETRTRVRELVEEGALRKCAVEGWKEPAYVAPGRARAARRDHATLLSPFDSLIWDRARTARLFDFAYRIEVYTPEREREYGYFVMPVLLGDALVGRLDLKADRKAGTLLVRGAYTEPGVEAGAIASEIVGEVAALRDWLGLHDMVVARRGNLAPALRRVAHESMGS